MPRSWLSVALRRLYGRLVPSCTSRMQHPKQLPSSSHDVVPFVDRVGAQQALPSVCADGEFLPLQVGPAHCSASLLSVVAFGSQASQRFSANQVGRKMAR